MILCTLQTHPYNENRIFRCEEVLARKNLFSLQGWVFSEYKTNLTIL